MSGPAVEAEAGRGRDPAAAAGRGRGYRGAAGEEARGRGDAVARRCRHRGSTSLSYS